VTYPNHDLLHYSPSRTTLLIYFILFYFSSFFQGYQHGHWVWKALGKAARPQLPAHGSYAEWFADFRNPNNNGRYGQGYGQDGR
jgi:hypothetical protein